MRHRDFSIDVLRFVGMVFIILCHVGPPPVLFNIRNFDVTMLVFASGLSFAVQDRNYLESRQSYTSYIVKRAKRLLLPTWCFLGAYFLVFNILGVFFPNSGISFSASDYLLSFTLISGIGYVWIFRVYLLVAIASPLLYALANRGGAKFGHKLIILVILMAANEVLIRFLAGRTDLVCLLAKYTLAYMTGYGVVVFASFIAYQRDNRSLLLLGGGSSSYSEL